MAADTWANADLWTADELRTALILHRMITDPAMAGRALGAQLLDHATKIARAAGRPWLRLDAWTTKRRSTATTRPRASGTSATPTTPSAAQPPSSSAGMAWRTPTRSDVAELDNRIVGP